MKLNLESAGALEWSDAEHSAINMMVKFSEFPEALPFAAKATDIEAHGRLIFEMAVAGEFGPIAPYVDRVPTPEQTIAKFTVAIQQRLDDFARTRNYDNILSACTYATSTVAKFSADGQYCVDARDATWRTCYTILADVQAGTRPMPTLEQILAELPVLAWP